MSGCNHKRANVTVHGADDGRGDIELYGNCKDCGKTLYKVVDTSEFVVSK